MSIAREGLASFEKCASMKSIGQLLQRSWQLKRSLSNDVSNNTIDEIYKRAMNSGAYGGRLLGAGGGGFLMFLAPPDAHDRIKEALADLVKVWVPFNFDQEGAKVILCSDD
jgi:D-glycero-alpha-D-manno-heptose-7-phosphate kinase